MPEDKKNLLGEILVERRVITEADLQDALDEQKISKNRLGKILIGKGKASPTDILNALSLKLTYSTQTEIKRSTLSFIDRLKNTRIPIKVRLSVFITLLVVIIMAFLSFFYFRSQRDEFISQTVRLGKAIVVNLAYNSSVPLLEDDEANLHILLEEVSKIEDIEYAMILGKTELIRAHTDINKVNQPYDYIYGATILQSDDQLEIKRYYDKTKETLDFYMPVEFNKVKVGGIHVGISLETLQKKISETRLFVISLTLLIISAGIGISFFISTQFSKPIYMLVNGTREIKNGNYNFKIDLLSNDELGDLTASFNDMAEGLRKKEIIQDAFGKYVAPEVVDMILKHPDEKWLKGKKLEATVMFADIRGFTSFSENTIPEEVIAVLNNYFTLATEIIFQYDGHVDKFIGDEVMAVFGVLLEHEDHPARAVMAALALQKELNTANLKLENSGKKPVKVGIGINVGELIVGNIGSKKRMEYTVIGDTVNFASRLTRLAGPDEIIISDSVYQKVSEVVIVEALDSVMVKGKSAPVKIYRVKGINQQVC
jgi:adenylate cyclase